jgi:hypothetical protein
MSAGRPPTFDRGVRQADLRRWLAERLYPRAIGSERVRGAPRRGTPGSFVQGSQEAKERAPELRRVVHREPRDLSLEKRQGNPIGLMCDDARGCVRIYIEGLEIVERS